MLETATDGAFFNVLAELLDANLAPQFVLERRAPTFVLLVIGLARGGDEIVVEREVPIDWGTLDERTKLGVLELWVSTILEKAARDVARINTKLAARGLAPIVLPR